MVERSNHAAERAVLAACLLDPDALALVAPRLRPADFHDPAHGTVFEAMLALDHSGAVDVVTLAEELRRRERFQAVGGYEFLTSLSDSLPVVAHVERHAALIADASRVRAIRHAAREVVAKAEDGKATALELATFAAERVHAATQDTVAADGGPVRLEKLLESGFARIEARAGKPTTGLETGLRGWDRLTGGLHPGQLVIVAARPGVGKSALVFNVARHAATKGTVLVFSLEMTREEFNDRLLCCEARVSQTHMRDGKLTSDEMGRLTVAASGMWQLPLWVDDRAGQTFPAIRAKAMATKRRNGLALIIVDYLQLVRNPGSEDRRLEVEAVARGLKELAKELKCPVLACAQLNRSVEGRGADAKPRLSDLRESGELEQAADVVAFLCRDMTPGSSAPEAELVIAKQRNGPCDSVPLRFERTFCEFTDPPAQAHWNEQGQGMNDAAE